MALPKRFSSVTFKVSSVGESGVKGEIGVDGRLTEEAVDDERAGVLQKLLVKLPRWAEDSSGVRRAKKPWFSARLPSSKPVS
jgi:hypothetical protein